MEGGKKIEATLDDMERSAALINAKQTNVWFIKCERDAYILRSHSGDFYTMRGNDVVQVTRDPTVCGMDGHGTCRCYPVFAGQLWTTPDVADAANAARTLGGPEGWAKVMAKQIRFDKTIWRLWAHVWWSQASTARTAQGQAT